MRTVNLKAATVTAVAGAAAAVAAGRLAGDTALRTSPDRPLPTEPHLTVHDVGEDWISLTRDLAALRPGVHGLVGRDTGDGGPHAVVGPVRDDLPHAPDAVVRRLERVSRGVLRRGDRVWFSPAVHVGNPVTALDLTYADVEVPGELGLLPGWFLPGQRSTWVIAAHGLGSTREQVLNLLPFFHDQAFPVLALAHRGDPGAPRSPDRRFHFGETEWRDLDAAIRYAVRYGARRVVLLGWSAGATMALRAAQRSGLRSRVAGVVLDSPVLDWEATARTLATARGVPRALLPLAVRATRGRLQAHEDPAWDDPEPLRTPTLILHGPDDRVADWQLSRALADRLPHLVTLQTFRGAPHAAMWNSDPARYEEAVRRFLTPFM
ncbi:alpha/beta hydrolase [Streptomyces sp. NPDC002640]